MCVKMCHKLRKCSPETKYVLSSFLPICLDMLVSFCAVHLHFYVFSAVCLRCPGRPMNQRLLFLWHSDSFKKLETSLFFFSFLLSFWTMEKYDLSLAGYIERIQPPLDFFELLRILLLQTFNLRISLSHPQNVLHSDDSSFSVWKSQSVGNRREGAVGEEASWDNGSGRLFEQEESAFIMLPIKQENLGEMSADSLSGPITAPAFSILGCLSWESSSSGLAVPDQNLCWWPQQGPFWGTTIFLTFSNCLSTIRSFPPSSLLPHCLCGSLPLPTLQTELCRPQRIPFPEWTAGSLLTASSLINILEVKSNF